MQTQLPLFVKIFLVLRVLVMGVLSGAFFVNHLNQRKKLLPVFEKIYHHIIDCNSAQLDAYIQPLAAAGWKDVKKYELAGMTQRTDLDITSVLLSNKERIIKQEIDKYIHEGLKTGELISGNEELAQLIFALGVVPLVANKISRENAATFNPYFMAIFMYKVLSKYVLAYSGRHDEEIRDSVRSYGKFWAVYLSINLPEDAQQFLNDNEEDVTSASILIANRVFSRFDYN